MTEAEVDGRKEEVSEAALKVVKSSTPATRQALDASTSNLCKHYSNDNLLNANLATLTILISKHSHDQY